MNYQDRFNTNIEMSLEESISFILYKYFLNFPLGFFNWFFDDFLFTTIFLFIPNALLNASLIFQLLSYLKKTK